MTELDTSRSEPPLVSKAEYARLKNVSRQRVSQWIAENKIGREALVGDGPGARVNVALANEHLNARLDVSQRFGLNGLDTRVLPAQSSPAPSSSAPAPVALVIDTIEEQIKRARLEGIEFDNRRKAEDEAARAGRYADAESVKQMFGRQAGQMVAEFDGILADIATDVAATWHLPQRDVLHRMRTKFRERRANVADTLAKSAAEMPPTIEDVEIGEDEVAN